MLYTASSIGMAGCCDGDTQSCGWAKSCVNYDAYTKKSCDSACMRDKFIRKCTDSATPYCVTWTYPSDGVADYGCADYNSGVETVLQAATDTNLDSTSMTLSTLSQSAVTGWDDEASSTEASSTETSNIFDFTTDSTEEPQPTETDTVGGSGAGVGSGGTTSKPKTTKKKKISVGTIAGAVIGALALLIIAGALIIFFCVKKKKEKQLAANQQAIYAAQANNQQQPPMQQSFAPPAPVQSPQPAQNGYFAPQDQKVNLQTQVHEYGVQSPISNPSTPAPAYVQPYYATPNAPPMPPQSPAPLIAREPTPGTHEADSIGVSPLQPQQHPVPPIQPHVFEMGSGK